MEEVIDKEEPDVRSCIIDIPKPKVYANRSIKYARSKKNFKGKPENRFLKPTETALKKYSLSPEKPLPVKECGKDELLLSFRQFARKEHNVRHKQRMTIKSPEQYKIRSTDLQKRLKVEIMPDDVVAISDIDKDFFNFINGRPRSQRGDSFKSIGHFFNYRLLKKIEVGYRMDTILNIDVKHKKEQREYELSLNRCTNDAKNFDKFISEDYAKSMASLKMSEELKYDVLLKNIEIENYSSQIFTITSRLVSLDYKYTLQQRYGRFLYYLSPPSWRASNREFAHSVEIEIKGFDLGRPEDDSFSAIFDKMQKECCDKLIKPVLYFTEPEDLMGVFKTIEMQQQYQFDHALRMYPLIKQLRTGITRLKDIISQDSAAVAGSIEGFNSLIKFYTERGDQLEEKFFKILNGLFYKSVGTMSVLKFTLHLEFCCEKVCNEKPINTDITSMAKILESMYLDYNFQIESLNGDSVRKAVTECIKDDKEENKKVKEAAKELRLFERLEQELKIAFGPPAKRCGKIIIEKPLKKESSVQKKVKLKSIQKSSLTVDEMEYLRLFTDWNENDDPGSYLHRQNFA